MFIKLSYPVREYNFDEYMKRDSVIFLLDIIMSIIKNKQMKNISSG